MAKYLKELLEKNSKPIDGIELYFQVKKLFDPIFQKIGKNAWQIQSSDSTSIEIINKKEEIYSVNVLDTLIQNLSFRAVSENYEISKTRLRSLYKDIKEKYKGQPEAARQVFLSSLSDHYKAFVLTAHPTETLTTNAIDGERNLSNIMHSKEFFDWAEGGFKPHHSVVEKLNKAVEGLFESIKKDKLDSNLQVRHEVVRGVKFTERYYDAVSDIFLKNVDETLTALDGEDSGVEFSEIKKYFSKPIIKVYGWQTNDQDGNMDTRAYISEHTLFPAADHGIDKIYITNLIKIYDEFLDSAKKQNFSDDIKIAFKEDIKRTINKILNRLDPDFEALEKYNRSNESDFCSLDVPAQVDFLRQLKKASAHRVYDLTKNSTKILEVVINERATLWRNGDFDKKPFENYSSDLVNQLEEIDNKFGKYLPAHKTGSGYECGYNSLYSLAVGVSQFGDKALRSQLRQNSNDIRSAFIYVLEDIKNNGQKLPQIFDEVLVEFKAKKFGDQLNAKLSAALQEMDKSVTLRNQFKQFLNNRNSDYYNSLKLNDVVKEQSKAHRVSKEEIEPDIKAYDRLKSIELMVNNPDRYGQYISAECEGAETLFLQHILCRALVAEGKEVKTQIFSLPEAVDTISNNAKDWLQLLENPYVLEQIKKADPNPPITYDKNGKPIALTAGDVLAQMGNKDIPDDLKNKKLTARHIVMFPSSDINKVFSVPAATFLISDIKYKLVKAFAQKGIYLEFFEGAGSNILRGNPKDGKMATVQGRDARFSPESGGLKVVNWLDRETRRFLNLAKQQPELLNDMDKLRARVNEDPRFDFSNNDFENHKFISENPQKWDKFKALLQKVGSSYEGLYQSKEFSKFFSAATLQEFITLTSASSRPNKRKGDSAEVEIYPKDVSVDGIRAIQYAAALSMINPHGGIMMHKMFEGQDGKPNLTIINEALNDFRENSTPYKCPALREAINKAAISLAQADLSSAWRMFGIARANGDEGAFIKAGKNKLKIVDIMTGQHDEVLKKYLQNKGIYKNLADKNKYNERLDDEVAAIKQLCIMDINTVKSRRVIAAIYGAVAQGKAEITELDISEKAANGKHKNSKTVIMNSLPKMHRDEMQLSNEKTKHAFKRFAEIHLAIKKGELELPRKIDGKISPKDKNYGLFCEIWYLVNQVMENRERVVSGILRTQTAKVIEVENTLKNKALV